MVTAIASVLVFGTGFGSMQSFGFQLDALRGLDIANEFSQHADCAGVATSCGNDNSKNINKPTTPPTTPPNPDPLDCAACFVDRLNPTQLGNLKFVLGLPVDASNELLCTTIDDLTAAELRAAITAPVVGVTVAVANNIINCLIDAGFINLEE
jgi:hypothetical protein